MRQSKLMSTAIVFLVSLCAAAILPYMAIPILRRAQIIDVPNHRSLHDVPAVRGLGVVSTLGVLAAVAAVVALRLEQTVPVVMALGGCVLAALVGFAEDTVGLRVEARLLAQGLVATGVGIMGYLILGVTWWALPFIAGLIVGYINAANFMDGVNGISCLHGIMSGLHFFVVGHLLDQPWLVVTAAVLLAVHLGMLPWNVGGLAFLGDIGSYLLGSLVAICGVGVVLSGGSILLASAPASLYLADTLTTMLRRFVNHERLTEAHRSHVYQRLVSDGLTHLQSAAVVSGGSAVCSAVALSAAMGWLSTSLAALLVALILITYLALPRLFKRGPLGSTV